MSAEFIVPSDRNKAEDLLFEKRLLFKSMQILNKRFENFRMVPIESGDIPGLIKMFDDFDTDIEILGQEVATLEEFCNWEMN